MNEESFARETVYLKNVVIINEYAIRRRNEELSPPLRRIASALSTHQQRRCHPERSEGSHLAYNVHFT
jgi:hypothetical protein